MAQKIVVTLVGGIRAPSASREFDPSTGTLSRQINQIRLDTSDETESQASECERGALKYFDDSDFLRSWDIHENIPNTWYIAKY